MFERIFYIINFNYLLSIFSIDYEPIQCQILWSILEGRTEAHDRFVISHLDDLYKHLAESLSLAQPGAKKHRLKCLLSLVKKLDIENFEFVPSILPEVS